MTMDENSERQEALGPPVQRTVGRPVSERAHVGDAVAVDVRHPYPQTLRLVLETQAAVDKANELLVLEPAAWRLEKRVFAPPATVNRYCRAGMCVSTDAEHEPWCTAHRKPLNAELTGRTPVRSGSAPG